VLLLFVLGPGSARAQSPQFWPEIDFSITRGHINLLVPSLVRLDPTAANPQFVATGAVGTAAFGSHLSVSAGYLFADLPQKSAVAHVPLVAVTPILSAHRWSISDMSRFERLISYSNQPYRYRNRAGVDYALGKDRRVHIYAVNEYFVNLSTASWNQNRAQVGIGLSANRYSRFDLYYLQRSAPGGAETPVIGTVLTIRFNRR